MSGYSHLTAEERDRIAGLKADGLSLGVIARALGRAASTISREIGATRSRAARTVRMWRMSVHVAPPTQGDDRNGCEARSKTTNEGIT